MTQQTAPALPEAEPSANTLVREFLTAFEHNPSPELCRTLVREEVKEVAEAVENLLKEFCDLIYVLEQMTIQGVALETLEPQTLRNIADLFSTYCKVFPEHIIREAFKRVHASNMSKLVDGKPLRREDGKVLKGPNYAPPSLIDLI